MKLLIKSFIQLHLMEHEAKGRENFNHTPAQKTRACCRLFLLGRLYYASILKLPRFESTRDRHIYLCLLHGAFFLSLSPRLEKKKLDVLVDVESTNIA